MGAERKEMVESGGKPATEEKELTGPELLSELQNRLEELLSKENLDEDVFVQQHMNAQMYIPLCVLASHRLITRLGGGANVDKILIAAQRSEKLVVDEDNMLVRPNIKQRRNTLILHDLPDDFTEKELRDLFGTSPEAAHLTSVKPDVNNTAFVTFEKDEHAQSAALWLRTQKLRGETIHCKMKAEHVMRSFFPAVPGAMSWPASPWTGPATPQWNVMYDGSNGAWEDGKGKGKSRGRREGRSDSEADVNLEGLSSDMNMPMGAEAAMDDAEIGYTHDFRKFSRQDLIEICSAMEEVKKPESFAKFEKEDKDFPLFRQSPCKDWAPLPTPMISFASSVLEGGSRRTTGGNEEELEGGGRGGRNQSRGSRKGTSQSGWTRGSRTQSESEEAGAGGWDNWDWQDGDWGKGGGKGSRWRSTSRKRAGSGWESWNSGTTSWAEKDKGKSAWVEKGRERSVPKEKKPAWVEKGKEAEKAGDAAAPKWQKKTASEAGAEGGGSGSPDKAAAGDGASGTSPGGTLSWADKVRMGKS